MHLRYNYRLYPTAGQQAVLAMAFGCARVVFNDGLRARERAYKDGLPYLSDAERRDRRESPPFRAEWKSMLRVPPSPTPLGKHDHCTVLAGGFVIVGLGFGLTALAGSVAGYAATVAVWTLGEIVTAGLGAAIVADLAPVSMRGRYSGAYGAVWSAAYLLGPLGGTRLLALGAPVLWLTCGLLGAGAAAGLLALGPAIRRRSRAASLTGQVLDATGQ